MGLTRGHDVPGERAPNPGTRRRARDLAAATPPYRNKYVDLLRAFAIVAVVLGHWVVTAVTVRDGNLGWVNLLTTERWTHPLTWLFQVMPVVFLVGGYANAASWASHRGRGGSTAAWVRARALRLLRPTAVLLATLVVGYAAAVGFGARVGLPATAVWLAASSLWFLVVYLAVVGLAPALIAFDRRWGRAGALALVGIVAAGDVARLLTGSTAAAAANYLVVWAIVHQLGIAWHDGSLTRARWPAYAFAGGGLAVLVVLTVWGPYAVTMVGWAEPPELPNTAPPTLALLALASAQTGAVLLLRRAADRWLTRPRVWLAVVTLNAVVMTLYLWHLVPVVLAGTALMATGVFPQPAVGSGEWFALRIPWVLVLAVLLAGLVAAVGRWESRAARTTGLDPSPLVVALGVVACLAGLLGLGVGGTDGLLPALAGVPVGELVLFAAGLALLSTAGRRHADVVR